MADAPSLDAVTGPAVPARTRRRLPDWAWAVLYGLAWILTFQVSKMYWFVPAGLRIGALLVAPVRMWPWLAVFEYAAILSLLPPAGYYRSWAGFLLANFAPWLVHAGMVWKAREQGWVPRAFQPRAPQQMGRLLLLFFAAAAGSVLVLTPMAWIELRVQGAAEIAGSAIRYWIGDVIAMLIIAPVMLAVAGSWQRLRALRGALVDVALLMLLLAAFCTLALVWPRLSAFALVLALAPMLLLAFRHGWRGAAFGLLLTSAAIYAIGLLGAFELGRELMQLILAVLGATTLTLGAATDAFRDSVRSLDASNRELAEANERLRRQSRMLQDVSQRLIGAQEDEQKRIAHELEDELGRAVSTLGVRLGMAAREASSPAEIAAVDSMRETVRNLQVAVRGIAGRLLSADAPADWTRPGLQGSPVGQLLADAGMELEVGTAGPAETLPVALGRSLMQVCALVATDCIRRGDIRGLAIDLRVQASGEPADRWVRLQLLERRSARPGMHAASPRDGALGLRIQERALSLGGEYRWEETPDGARHDLLAPFHGGAAQDPLRSS